jgi:hypothetical protein
VRNPILRFVREEVGLENWSQTELRLDQSGTEGHTWNCSLCRVVVYFFLPFDELGP